MALRFAALTTTLLVPCAAIPVASAAAAAPAKPYIVVLDKSSKSAAKATTNRLADEEDFTTTHRFGTVVQGFSAKLDAHDVAELRDDPRVAFVTPDRPVKALGLVPMASGDNIPAGVRRVGAAVDTSVREASTGNVAVIDTGVDLSHPDLNAVSGKSCNGTGLATDGNGHGTHVAGTIAARNNGVGAVGVAPGTKIVAVRVLDASGSGLTSSVICGIDYVTSTRTDSDPANDIAVANMSLGGSGSPTADCGRTVGDAFHIAICNSVAAGVTYVVAAGNSGADEQFFTPAAYPEVLTVTSVSDSDGLPGGAGGTLSCINNPDDSPASYSNFATRDAEIAHTIAAPGSCIRSTYPGNRYATMSGTSMASPHVAGLVALCVGEGTTPGPCAGRTPAQVVDILRRSASDAATADPARGFTGDPNSPNGARYYGYLGSATFTPSDTPLPPAPPAPAVAPVNTVKPAVSGDRTIGSTLASTVGTWTGTQPLTTKTQWQRCNTTAGAGCVAIAGATSTGYAPTTADIGKVLRVLVTATNAKATVTVASATTAAVPAPIVAPANVKAPVIGGTAKIGLGVTTTSGTWSGSTPMTVTVQWLRCTSSTDLGSCTEISGARAGKYVVTRADGGLVLRARLTATNSKGSATSTSAASGVVPSPAGSGPPVPTAQPTISGTPAAGSTLTAFAGSWTGATPLTTTVWWASCAPGSNVCYYTGDTGPTYTPTSGPAGTRWVIVVQAKNPAGTAYAQSFPTAPAAAGTTGMQSTGSSKPVLV
jgi:subtilisin family serine protease